LVSYFDVVLLLTEEMFIAYLLRSLLDKVCESRSRV